MFRKNPYRSHLAVVEESVAAILSLDSQRAIADAIAMLRAAQTSAAAPEVERAAEVLVDRMREIPPEGLGRAEISRMFRRLGPGGAAAAMRRAEAATHGCLYVREVPSRRGPTQLRIFTSQRLPPAG